MNKFDTLKFQFSIDALKFYNKSDFIEHRLIQPGKGEISSFASLRKSNYLGLNAVRIDESSVILEVSSKILRENYHNLIDYLTVEQLFNNINKSSHIKIDSLKAFETSDILRADVTSNIPVKNVDATLRNFAISSVNRKFKIENYSGGFVIASYAKSNTERMIIYNKLEELNKKTKKNIELNKYIDFNVFKNEIRIENNVRQFKKLRAFTDSKYIQFKKEYNIPLLRETVLKRNKIKVNVLDQKKEKVKFSDLLLSNYKYNYNMVKKMFLEDVRSDNNNNILFEIIDSEIKLYQIEKKIGRLKILELCGYDINAVKKFLKAKIGKSNNGRSNISKYFREYEELLNFVNSKHKDLNYESVKEVLNYLKVAA